VSPNLPHFDLASDRCLLTFGKEVDAMTAIAELVEKIESLKSILVDRATYNTSNRSEEYERLRRELMRDPRIKGLLPAFLRKCRNLSDFWAYISIEFGTYKERRRFLRDQFDAALTFLEERSVSPVDGVAQEVLETVDSSHVQQAWVKALERRDYDPEAAMTSARTLLETVCKHILDEMGLDYDDTLDLPKLYKLVANNMNLSPSHHTEQVFKQVLAGCQSVVEGLGALRNKLSDAHGKGKKAAKPAPRHATLTVNLSGAMATFLIETWELRKAAAAE
jgi:uncharacterized protein YfkK (UPF0435 family)